MSAPTRHTGGMLGRYRLLEQIGAGGMGIVYRAHDERLGRDVAIKLLAPGSIRSIVARHRVRNEAIALSRLSHPNIETIFEFDSQDDCDFLVVELIEGVSLDELLSRGPLPQTLAVSLTMQLLRGLAAAHEKGIIHRDLKPSNLRLTHESFLKILDFGIADLGDEKSKQAHELTTETHSTILTGTLAYMSPEQLRGTQPDARSDIYGAGLVLYQMCVGRPPYSETGALLIDAILNRPVPPPIKFNAEICQPLQEIILKALQKDPRQRYQSAREMLRDLEVLDDAVARRATRRLRRTVTAGIVVLVLGVLIGLENRRIVDWVDSRLHPVPANKYVAVMPFRGIDNDDPAFDKGLSATVAAKLMEATSAQQVQIVSPRELISEHVADVMDARKKLGVNLAIEGTLQQIENKTVIHLELVDAATRGLLRARDISVSRDRPFALQDEVVDRTVQMLEIEIHKNIGAEGHGTTNPEAFKAYTRATGFLHDESHPEDLDGAISQFQQALRLDPGYSEAYAGLGIAYIEKYRDTRDSRWMKQSEDTCQRALDLDPQRVEGTICLGTFFLRSGQNQQAASNFRVALDKDPTNDDAIFGLATAYERLEDRAQAEDAYKKEIQIRPNYEIGYMRLGTFYSHQGRYADAGAQFRRATELNSEDPRPWSRLGGAYFLSGEYDKAIAALQHAIAGRPTYEAYSNLGLAYLALRRFPDAIAAFQQAVSLGPSEIQPYGNLGRAYYYFPPTHSQAREPLQKALRLTQKDLTVNPNDADARLLAAEYYSMLKDDDKALQNLDIALRLRPSDPETLYFAAIVHSQMREYNEALKWLKQAIAKGYSTAEISRAVEFDELRHDPRFTRLLGSQPK